VGGFVAAEEVLADLLAGAPVVAGGSEIHPRPVNQAALDTCLDRADPDVQARFAHLTEGSLVPAEGAAEQPPIVGEDKVCHPHDASTMVRIEGSVFLSGPSNEPVWVPTYYIDVYPVTNAQYARFLEATGRDAPQGWSEGKFPPGLDNHSVVFVTWPDATAYAEWAGKSLPTSQQWEKAARGTRGTAYPWCDQPTPAKCNVRENGVGETTAVDCYQTGISPYGVYDLCGNVWEWCSTESKPGRHELKGGSWTTPFERCTPSTFNDAFETMCDHDTGFRCVAPVQVFE